MKTEESIKVGDEVWVYNSPLKPLEAIVTYVDDIFGYKCKFLKNGYEFFENNLYGYHNIFRRPTAWSDLVKTLRDDAYTLDTAADKLERKYDNTGE